MDKIEAKINTIQNTVSEYKACRIELENMLKELDSGIQYLKQNWEGQAKASFFNVCYPQFSDGINKHIKLIAFFEKELDNYCQKLTGLSNELKRNIS